MRLIIQSRHVPPSHPDGVIEDAVAVEDHDDNQFDLIIRRSDHPDLLVNTDFDRISIGTTYHEDVRGAAMIRAAREMDAYRMAHARRVQDAAVDRVIERLRLRG